jgi:transposase
MSYIVKQKIGNKYYAYEVESYWDKDKKQPRQRRKYLGVWDEEKGIVRKRNVVKTTKSYGDVYLFSEIVRQIELEEALRVYPEWKQILSLAFSRLRHPSSLRLSKPFLEDTFFGEIYKTSILTSQRISRLLEKIPEKLPEFFLEWIRRKNSSALIYDITSLSSASRNINLLEFGYNRDGDGLPQINLGVVVTKESIPIYFKVFPGSIKDVTTLHNLIEDLKEFKVEDYSLILDRGFYSKTNVKELLERGIDFVIPLPFTTKEAKKLSTIKLAKNARRYKGRTIFVAEGKIDLNGNSLFAYLFYDEKRKAEETDSFFNRLMDVEELNGKVLRESLDSFLSRIKYRKYFNWKVKEGRVYCERKPKAISRRVNRFGKLIILSSRRMEWEEILSAYRQKDVIEKFYYSLKDIATPLRVRKEETLLGLLFVNFLALIVKNQILRLMRESKLIDKMSVEEVFLELSKLRAVKLDKEWRLTEITKTQRTIMEKMGMSIPNSMPSY